MIAMLRPMTWFWLALVLVMGGVMFCVKYQVTALAGGVAEINRRIDADRTQTRLLEAEWSVLNQPARLDQLRRRFLPGLVPLTGTSFGSLDQVPFRHGEQPAGTANSAPGAVSGTAAVPIPGGPSLASAPRRIP